MTEYKIHKKNYGGKELWCKFDADDDNDAKDFARDLFGPKIDGDDILKRNASDKWKSIYINELEKWVGETYAPAVKEWIADEFQPCEDAEKQKVLDEFLDDRPWFSSDFLVKKYTDMEDKPTKDIDKLIGKYRDLLKVFKFPDGNKLLDEIIEELDKCEEPKEETLFTSNEISW